MSKKQRKPTKNNHLAVWPAVIKDMQNRHKVGIKRYGTALQPFNGRKSLQDLYEELLDACAYIKQNMMEETFKNNIKKGKANEKQKRN